ncbi:glycosyl hydrolase [Actinoplanes sp. NPDC026619]|uniref:glycosyl hydrolase n=1 Tax=Actinoplanes sp. NPDC026619 TaxID=3155798 RepID=UPI0033E44D1F
MNRFVTSAAALLLAGAAAACNSTVSEAAPVVSPSTAATTSETPSTSPSPSGSPSVSPSAGASPKPEVAAPPLVAPYVDIVSDTADIADVKKKTGLTDFVVAFVVADQAGTCTPTWDGTVALTDKTVAARLKKIGGDIVVATGGATGTYLESVCSAAALATAYTEALDVAGSNHLDVDIERPINATTVVAALARLQKSRQTAITLTLPVGDGAAGLTADGLALLRSIEKAGLTVTVNAMTMNFGADGDWGTAMTAAMEAVHDDLATVWSGKSDKQLYAMLGITPMIGVNDTGPVTTVADARTVLGYAERKGLAFVRFWSINRDNGDCADGSVSGSCSGIAQSDYAFTKLFATYAE